MNLNVVAATRAETRSRTTSTRGVVRTCKVKPTSRGGHGQAWPANASSKRSRHGLERSRQGHSAPPKVPIDLSKQPCVACGAANGPLATCKSCSGVYHPRCFDPPSKTLPRESWVCCVCHAMRRPSGAATGAATGAAAICTAANAAASPAPHGRRQPPADPRSVALISSVLARLSAETAVSERPLSLSSSPLSPTAVGAGSAATQSRPRPSPPPRGERTNNLTDSVLAWALRRVGAGELGNLAMNGGEGGTPGVPPLVETPSCHCGDTDSRRPITRCTGCACVVHLHCMDPPCDRIRNLPREGYTCRACRENRPDILKAPPGGWTSEGGSGGGGGFVILGEAGGSRRGGRVGGGGGDGQAGRGVACAVCGVSEGKKNICGSCGDGYHSLCLDRPRTRRAGGSWLCDACRSSSPTPSDTKNGVGTAGLRAVMAGTAIPEPSGCDSGGLLVTMKTSLAAKTSLAVKTSGAVTPSGGARVKQTTRPPEKNTGYWLKEEHDIFLEVRAVCATTVHAS